MEEVQVQTMTESTLLVAPEEAIGSMRGEGEMIAMLETTEMSVTAIDTLAGDTMIEMTQERGAIVVTEDITIGQILMTLMGPAVLIIEEVEERREGALTTDQVTRRTPNPKLRRIDQDLGAINDSCPRN